MSLYDPNDEPDDGRPSMPDAVRAEADALLERWNKATDKARLLGLYAQGEPTIMSLPTPMGMRLGIVVQFDIGDVAWSDRVQHPEKAAVDKEFRKIEIHANDDAFLDEHERIERALKAGKSPLEILLGDEADDDTEDMA